MKITPILQITMQATRLQATVSLNRGRPMKLNAKKNYMTYARVRPTQDF